MKKNFTTKETSEANLSVHFHFQKKENRNKKKQNKITWKSQIKAILQQTSHSLYVMDAHVFILHKCACCRFRQHECALLVICSTSLPFCCASPVREFAWQRYWNRNVLMARKRTITFYVTELREIQCEHFKIICMCLTIFYCIVFAMHIMYIWFVSFCQMGWREAQRTFQ